MWVPFFRDGVFWGIAGMDIDFDVVISNVRSIRAYDSGYAFLCSDSGEIYCHPELDHNPSFVPFWTLFTGKPPRRRTPAFSITTTASARR